MLNCFRLQAFHAFMVLLRVAVVLCYRNCSILVHAIVTFDLVAPRFSLDVLVIRVLMLYDISCFSRDFACT